MKHALQYLVLACMQCWFFSCAGITPHMLTLVQNFYVPFMREVLLLHGVCNCARKTCLNLLSKCAAEPCVEAAWQAVHCLLASDTVGACLDCT